MTAKDEDLTWLSNSVTKLEIPFFQRPYVWENDDCKSLIDGIIQSADNRMPFIGSIIIKYVDKKHFLVIDGQQRLITLSILIKAILDSEKLNIQTNIYNTLKCMLFKMSTGLDGTDIFQTKIEPSYADKESFDKVINIDGNLKDNYNQLGDDYLCSNYKFFRNLIETMTRDEVLKLALKLNTDKHFFIVITLEDDDDEQRIFDSVNTLGKPLSCADIIKNYLYQKIKEKSYGDTYKLNQLHNIYKKYWDDIFYLGERREFWDKEKVLGRIKYNYIDIFFKNFATLKEIFIPSATGGTYNISNQLKKYIDSLNYDELVYFAKEISEYALCYYAYITEYQTCESFTIDDNTNNCLLVLDKLNTSTFDPFVLKVIFNKPDNYENILFELQRFVLSRYLFDAKTKNYNKCCSIMLARENPIEYLLNYNYKEDPIDFSKFPNKVHKVKNNHEGTLLLFLIEEILRYGNEKKYCNNLRYNYSLEHIMPKKWTDNWLDVKCYKYNDITKSFNELITSSEEARQNRDEMIQSLGNMTLLSSALNKSLSNKSFECKIKGDGKHDGFDVYASSLSVNKKIIDTYNKYKTWNEKNIHNREVELYKILNEYYHFDLSSSFEKVETSTDFNSNEILYISCSKKIDDEVKNAITRKDVGKQKGIGKLKSIDLLKNKGYQLTNNVTYASINSSRPVYWINSQVSNFKENYLIILDDQNNRSLHILYLPANSINLEQLKYRNDKPTVATIEIDINSESFKDTKSGLSFVKYKLEEIKY